MISLLSVSIFFVFNFKNVVSFAPDNFARVKVSMQSSRNSGYSSGIKMSTEIPNFKDFFRQAIGTAAIVGFMSSPILAADYAPATPPPQLVPQVARQSPKAVQSNSPEKWIYSKFLDEVEKDDVEKVTFSPDGK